MAMMVAITYPACPNHGVHQWKPSLTEDAENCDCGAQRSGTVAALAESRARIEARCIEPGRAPAGASYPYQAAHVVLPVLTNEGVREIVRQRGAEL